MEKKIKSKLIHVWYTA